MDHPPRRAQLSSPTWLAYLVAAMLWIGAISARSQTSQEPEDSSPGIHWRTDKAAARKDALTEGRPILWYYRCDP